MDSQCSRKRESQNQPSGALFMDKDGFANRLRQMKSIGQWITFINGMTSVRKLLSNNCISKTKTQIAANIKKLL